MQPWPQGAESVCTLVAQELTTGRMKSFPQSPWLPSLKSHHELIPLISVSLNRGRKEEGVSICYVPQHPNPLGFLFLQPVTIRTEGTQGLLLDESLPGMQASSCKEIGNIFVTHKAGRLRCWLLSGMKLRRTQVVDYSSGQSAFNCIWKEHSNWRWWPTFYRLNWLSTPNKANLYECMLDAGPGHCLR